MFTFGELKVTDKFKISKKPNLIFVKGSNKYNGSVNAHVLDEYGHYDFSKNNIFSEDYEVEKIIEDK